MYLFHYYDKDVGPFVNLSDLPMEEAMEVLNVIRQTKPNVQSVILMGKSIEKIVYPCRNSRIDK